MTNYQKAKQALKIVSDEVKTIFKDDRALIRTVINDEVDSLNKDLNLSDYQRTLLSNYACKLHPKD